MQHQSLTIKINKIMGTFKTINCDDNVERQISIINNLEKLVHNRFSVESLEKKLSEIFDGEEIHIELGYIDVEDETAPDWNYMFTSEQDVIGGDFDIYVLMQRNKDCNGNTMYVTEVGYEFFHREY